ncbi:hypothetical protein FRC07_010060 [Ceratobasidium sp. 392]|nr:hypothetical protein FRC07_010060 [Ceratobasidium sp. 392]
MTSLDSGDNQWGVTVSQYLALGPRGRLSEQLKRIQDQAASGNSQTSMEAFLAQQNQFTSLATLSDVLLLAQSPRNLPQFNNTGMIPACIRLLKEYAQDYNKLFDRTYGLLCLDLFSVTLQVGMLANYGRLDPLVKSLKGKRKHGPDVTSMLEEQVAQAIHDATHAENHPPELRRLLGWTSACIILPLCGGFTEANTMFILELLWEDKELFFTVVSSHLLPRYASILFLLWQSLIRINR